MNWLRHLVMMQTLQELSPTWLRVFKLTSLLKYLVLKLLRQVFRLLAKLIQMLKPLVLDTGYLGRLLEEH